jgi:hypothetical protein
MLHQATSHPNAMQTSETWLSPTTDQDKRLTMADIQNFDKDSIEYLSCITSRMVETCEVQLKEELAKRDRLVKKVLRVVPRLQQTLHELTEHRALQAKIMADINAQNQLFDVLD